MRRVLLLLALIGVPAGAQSVDCHTIGNSTHCETSHPLNLPPGPDNSALLNSGGNIGRALAGSQTVPVDGQVALSASDRAEERKRLVYIQVGSLIAAGKCTEARRLADFHGQPQLISDTAKACPN